MKNILMFLLISWIVIFYACEKDEQSEKFKLLIAPTWVTDSLLAGGVDASGPGGFLEKFKGEAKFKEDGTGTFGKYTGKWLFNPSETQVTITTDSIPLPINCNIKELTTSSLKVTAVVPNLQNLTQYVNIRMTFKAK